MPDDLDDVLAAFTQQIQARFQMPLHQLRDAVAAVPEANPDATTVVRWYGHLEEAQVLLSRAEDDLVLALDQAPVGELDDPVMALADRVNALVAVRDGRAMVVRHLLDDNAPGRRTPGPWRGTLRTGPAIETTPVARTAAAPSLPVRGGMR
ncbi:MULTISPECIES: hypothetical protein [unclassified Streptomyces]|uniref:hypothetical protein n=1 Tax=unclassified Streptomyces TaxID=2593676 RepID=UPI000DC79823|nr:MULTISPECIES: hypothetical protein [unclassified Streptomyces]AWZ08355.1 hypothetical protein DRB89_31455 [Streptomyces sp. ICC4]AWZ16131.1 hypothetical protein DRB96_32190 [Streptomyces sp. ICC1]